MTTTTSKPTPGNKIVLIGAGDVWALTPWLFGGVLLMATVTSIITLRRYLRV